IFAGLLARYWGSWLGAVVVLAMVGSLMVSYVRSRGESIGEAAQALSGTMQRPERIFLLGLALAASPFFPEQANGVVAAALSLLAVSSHITALSRARAVFRALRRGEAGVVEMCIPRDCPELAGSRRVSKPRVSE